MARLRPRVRKTFIVLDSAAAPSVHCASVQAAGRYVYVVYFGGTREGAPDVKIYFSLSRDYGMTFSAAWIIAGQTRPEVVHYNPIAFCPSPETHPERLVVFFKTGAIPEWITWAIETDDAGTTWSDPRELVRGDRDGGRGPSKNPVLVLRNGDWIAGGSREVVTADGTSVWDAFADIAPAAHGPPPGSTQGSTWQRSPLVPLPMDRGNPAGSFPGEGVIQPTLWESPYPAPPGQVHMLLRSGTGRLVRSDSTDAGRTWSEGRKTALPNNNSGVCLARMREVSIGPDAQPVMGQPVMGREGGGGRLVLALNPVEVPRGPRTPLVCLVSQDEGEMWAEWCVLEDEGAGPAPNDEQTRGDDPGWAGRPEFSYPTVAPTSGTDPDGCGVWVSYTWKRRGIVLVKITDAQ